MATPAPPNLPQAPPYDTLHPTRKAYVPTRHPFGLPLGTVRGVMALLILSYFWLVVFWPAGESGGNVVPLIGHFFLLPLVLYSFTLSSHGRNEPFHLMPFLVRLGVVLGTVGVIGYMMSQGLDQYRDRLTPNFDDFKLWWMPFSITLAVGYLAGHTARMVAGAENPYFLTLRDWLSVLGLVMLMTELVLFIVMLSMKSVDPNFKNFLHYFEFVEITVVAAYFGTRV